MGDLQLLLSKVRDVADRLSEAASEKRNILVLGHIDADGICSASILCRAIGRKGGRFTVRILRELDLEVLD